MSRAATLPSATKTSTAFPAPTDAPQLLERTGRPQLPRPSASSTARRGEVASCRLAALPTVGMPGPAHETLVALVQQRPSHLNDILRALGRPEVTAGLEARDSALRVVNPLEVRPDVERSEGCVCAPEQVAGFAGVTQLASGVHRTCATHPSSISCWGGNLKGQIGADEVPEVGRPAQIRADVLGPRRW